MVRRVEVVDYDVRWDERFDVESQRIRTATTRPQNLVSVNHIGSTSVVGLAAKPIIDILLVVKNLEELDSEREVFERLGYEYLGEFGIPGRRYMRKGLVQGRESHHIHAFQYDNISEIQRHLSVRNYLRRHPGVAERYGELKKRLAAQFPTDIEGYSQGKDAFVQAMERDALMEHWRREEI